MTITFHRNTSATRRFSHASLFGREWFWLGPVRVVIGPKYPSYKGYEIIDYAVPSDGEDIEGGA